MDEVDKIIIHSLRSVGCTIDDEHIGLGTFTSEMIYDAVLHCVKAIKSSECPNVPSKLPPGMSQRFRAGSALASLVKEVGYTGEIGYQTFLYSNEGDIRKLLMHLVDKLPRDTAGTGDDSAAGSAQQLSALIRMKFKDELKKVWLPHVCCQNVSKNQQHFRGQNVLYPQSSHKKKLPEEMTRYYNNYLIPISRQFPNVASLCSALVERNSLLLVADQRSQWYLQSLKQDKSKKYEDIKQKLVEEKETKLQQAFENNQSTVELPESRFTQLEQLQHTSTAANQSTSDQSSKTEPLKDASEEEIREKQEQEIASLRAELQEISNRITKLNKSIEKANTATDETKSEVSDKKKVVEEQKKLYQVKKKTLDVLPEAEQTISRVKKLIDGADERMKSLEQQWNSHKGPLVQQIEDMRTEATTRHAALEQKLDQLKGFKSEMKIASEEAKAKDEQLKSLNLEYQNMSKDVSRSSYTKRIIEIVGNIKKQKRDIDKVLEDTRVVQKDINSLTGKLDRTFTVTDELIFKDARRDESVKAAYKYLASLHDNFTAVRATIEETGTILRQIRQLEDQIDQESSKEPASNLEKIMSDYKQIKKENQQLMVKLKQ